MPIISPEQREPSCQLPLHPGSCEGGRGAGGPGDTLCTSSGIQSHTCVRSFPVGMGTRVPAWEKHGSVGFAQGVVHFSVHSGLGAHYKVTMIKLSPSLRKWE